MSLQKALELSAQRNYGGAKKILHGIVAASPGNGLAWFNLGTASFNSGDFDDAISAFRRVIELSSPLAPGAALCLAKCYRKKKAWGDAIKLLSELNRSAARADLADALVYEERELAKSLNTEGTERLEAGKAGEALPLFDLSLRTARGGDAAYGRALALTSLTRYDEARTAFRLYLRDFPDSAYESDARYFLDRLESAVGGGPVWLNVELGGGYNSNVYVTGASAGPADAPAAQATLATGAQVSGRENLIARLAYTGSWLEDFGQTSGRITAQSVQGQLGYHDAKWLARVMPSVQYQTLGTDPYQLQGSLAVDAERSFHEIGLGVQGEADKNYGQIATYSYLNGYNFWGEAHLDYIGYRVELRFSYSILYEDIGDLVSGTTTLPLNDIAQGPGIKIYWSPDSGWETWLSASFLFRNYANPGEPGGLTRYDTQLLSSARVRVPRYRRAFNLRGRELHLEHLDPRRLERHQRSQLHSAHRDHGSLMERAQLKTGKDELAALVREAQAGDEAALPKLIAATEERLYRFLLFLSGDSQLANDLGQDTYLYAFEQLAKISEPQAFLHWLFKVARNKFLDHKKSPRNRPTTPVETLDSPDLQHSPEKRELVIQVRKAFGTLDPDERLVLCLVDIEGYTLAEAAKFIGISEAALTSRVRRARARFHKEYFGGG